MSVTKISSSLTCSVKQVLVSVLGLHLGFETTDDKRGSMISGSGSMALKLLLDTKAFPKVWKLTIFQPVARHMQQGCRRDPRIALCADPQVTRVMVNAW